MKKENNSQKGQALIELIIFLPLMITVYSVIGGFASSINGSINQQKIARSYFYFRIQNNSSIPGPTLLGTSGSSWKKFGMFYIGWKDHFINSKTPVMPCYKITIPFKENPSDQCDQAYTDPKTLWIRVGTVYGVCSTTHAVQNDKYFLIPDGGGSFTEVLDKNSCTISQ
jgi:hypothetical protein